MKHQLPACLLLAALAACAPTTKTPSSRQFPAAQQTTEESRLAEKKAIQAREEEAQKNPEQLAYERKVAAKRALYPEESVAPAEVATVVERASPTSLGLLPPPPPTNQPVASETVKKKKKKMPAAAPPVPPVPPVVGTAVSAPVPTAADIAAASFPSALPPPDPAAAKGKGEKNASMGNDAQITMSAAAPKNDWRAEADVFLKNYNTEYVRLYIASSEAEWRSNTHIVTGDSTNALATRRANEAIAAFQGSETNINRIQQLLKHADELTPLQARQLNVALYNAASSPQTVAAVVKRRIKAETKQTEALYGYEYKLDGKAVTTNAIDDLLRIETDPAKRLAAWEASKAIGPTLRPGLLNLRDLRNQVVQALGYPDYFTYQVSDYGLTRDEMRELTTRINKELRPLYRELHTWARYELAKKYNAKKVPALLPAHWLPNRWGQDWSALVDVKGLDLNAVLAKKGAKWQVEQAERFYQSLGFEALPKSFYAKSDLYPLPATAKFKKNNHASAWHLDLNRDVRSLMSVESNQEWYETTHHELGHIYYYLSYSTPEVPPLLRQGANRAYHEAVGSLMGLAASQQPFLAGLGLIDKNVKTDQTQALLKEALQHAAFIPFATGTMTEWEHDFYAQNMSAEKLNDRWWALAKEYQGIAPPAGAGSRGEQYLDPATKTHINDDPAQYYDYALSTVLLFQLHDHIAKKILKQDPHATNYYGSKPVGDFLKGLLRPGASGDWRKMLKDATGEDLSARAMVEYFQPLMQWLQEQNKGREYTM